MKYEFTCRSSFFDAIELIGEEGLRQSVIVNHDDLSIIPANEDVSEMVYNLLDTAGLIEVRDDYEHDQFRTDAEADADVLASAGMGTDEDYEHNSCDEGY